MPRRTLLVSLAALLLGAPFVAGPALAQSNPSADSIIRSLRPDSGLTGRTRGIRPVGPAESPAPASPAAPAALPRAATPAASPGTRPPPAPPPPHAAAAAPAEAPSVNLSVQFATDSAELTPAATRTLDELGRALSSQALSSYRFRIEGHTDTVGSREHNQALSEQRARSVVAYLSSKFGVDRARIEAVGMGEEHPVVITGPNVPEARNRRVTVVNIGT